MSVADGQCELGVVELAKRLATQLDPREVCEALLARADDSAVQNAYITLTPDRARSEARASAQRHRDGRPRSPLDGVPIAWKDLFDVVGTRTTAGSATRRTAPPAITDAAAVRALAGAGAICLGKTNLSEFAFSGLGLNPHFGTPRNPHSATPRVPGGSSSGSAVLVAAKAAPCAIGTDTSGSVRVPAAFCGIVGYKATGGRIPTGGMTPLAPSLDSLGTLTRTVADAIAVERALRSEPSDTELAAPLNAEIKLVVPTGFVVSDADDDVGRCFDQAISRLAQAGITVHTRNVPELDQVQRLFDEHGPLVAAEAGRTYAKILDGAEASLIDRRARRRLQAGRHIEDNSYETLKAERKRLIAAIHDQLGGHLLAFPTVRQTAPLIGPLEHDDALFVETNSRSLRSTMLTSYLDLPGVTLPIGTGKNDMPVGLLISAPTGADDHLLNACLALETALNHDRIQHMPVNQL